MNETLELIREIELEKLIAKRRPIHALVHEVTGRRPEAAQELQELERNGVIRIGDTINHKYIVILGSKK